jgi:hypothetical protein
MSVPPYFAATSAAEGRIRDQSGVTALAQQHVVEDLGRSIGFQSAVVGNRCLDRCMTQDTPHQFVLARIGG